MAGAGGLTEPLDATTGGYNEQTNRREEVNGGRGGEEVKLLCNCFEMVNKLPPLLRQRCVLSKLSSVGDSCWTDIGQFSLGKNNLAILYGSRTQAPALNNILEKCSTFWRGGI